MQDMDLVKLQLFSNVVVCILVQRTVEHTSYHIILFTACHIFPENVGCREDFDISDECHGVNVPRVTLLIKDKIFKAE